MNTIHLGGRLTKPPEMRYFESGSVVTEFSIAVDRRKKKGQEKADTDFFVCKAWGSLAEAIAEHMQKGDYINVQGRLEPESWTDDGGSKHTKVVISVSEWNYAPKGRKSEN